jgi:hypothetical protein
MTLKRISQTFVAAFLLLSAGFVNGQAGMSNTEDIEKIKARTLLIMTEEPKEELLAKLKPEEQEKYGGEDQPLDQHPLPPLLCDRPVAHAVVLR